ncbi:MAG: hypothetical protein II371_07235 [Flavobacteriales bacterium]|jgi:hypothetical protein|nr:hypothetical protein [Flavobacteriales bacterium]MBQ1969364.1 hypothetical protein [Flavobacteriales bacterium]MBQ5815354.1 hypothetical protein [Flavobacteriales bacterium]
MIKSNKILYGIYTAVMAVMAIVGQILVPETWRIFYSPWLLCVIMWAVFMLSFRIGVSGDATDPYRVLFSYVGGAAVRMVGVLVVVFYPVVMGEKGSFDGMSLIFCVMGIYAVSMLLYLMRIKNKAS